MLREVQMLHQSLALFLASGDSGQPQRHQIGLGDRSRRALFRLAFDGGSGIAQSRQDDLRSHTLHAQLPFLAGGLMLMHNIIIDESKVKKEKIKNTVRTVMGESTVKLIKKIIK